MLYVYIYLYTCGIYIYIYFNVAYFQLLIETNRCNKIFIAAFRKHLSIAFSGECNLLLCFS